jgi:hypothetical protein
MYTVAVSTLVTRCYQAGGWESNVSGGLPFMPQTEVIDKISQSYAKWYDKIRCTTWGGQYFRKTVTFNTTSAQSFYDFGTVNMTDFLDMISVDVYAGGPGATKITCRPYPEEMRNIFQFFPVGLLLTWPSFYQLQGNGSGGNGINFIPQPPGSYQIGCNYTPVATVLSSTTQTIDSINGWDEWIVLDVACTMAIKDRQFDLLGALQSRLAAEDERITSAIEFRDRGNAETPHDVTTNFDSWFFDE